MTDYSQYEGNLRIQVKDRIMRLELHNPEHLNANTRAMHAALSRIWDDIADDEEVAVVVFTGAGERAFSAGGDPKQLRRQIEDDDLWWPVVPESKRIVYRMLECDKPIVARLNGHAMGFGATLALCSDIIVAVETAKFGDAHVHAGLACGDGGALLWPQQIGFARAKEFLFTGRIVTAKEAAAMGLINHAVPREDLDRVVDEIAHGIANGAGRAIRLTKQVMNLPLRVLAHQMMDLGMANETLSHYSEDHAEAVRAMIDKDTPKFTGR